MPAWLLLIPELVKLIIEIWLMIKNKNKEEQAKVKEEVKQAVQDCPGARKRGEKREQLKARLRAIRDNLKNP